MAGMHVESRWNFDPSAQETRSLAVIQDPPHKREHHDRNPNRVRESRREEQQQNLALVGESRCDPASTR